MLRRNPNLTWTQMLVVNGAVWYLSRKRRNRMGFLKFLPLILKGKQVADVYRDETGAGKPIYLSRRFVGTIVTLIGVLASMYFSVSLDENILASLSDNVVSVISAGVTLYGVILGIIGVIKRKK